MTGASYTRSWHARCSATRPMNRLCHFILALTCACSGSSASPVPTSNAHAAIVGGTPSDASQDFVLVIANLVDPQGLECNAELVAPNLLVTARHCVAQLD